MKQAALEYLKKGYNIIPAGKDKRPLLTSWSEFQQKRITENMVNKWWDTWPDANISIVCGEISNLLVIDVDSENGLKEIDRINPEWQPTVKSPNGWHYWFQHIDGLTNAVKFATDCDIRTTGGLIIVPPSKNGSDTEYQFIDGSFENNVNQSLAAISLEFSRILSMRCDIRNVTSLSHPVTSCHILFQEGSRDNDLFHVANCLTKGGMIQENTMQILEILARNCKPPFPEKDIASKINSALKRDDSKKNTFAGLIREYILSQSGHISVTDCYILSQAVTFQEKTAVRTALYRLEKEGLIERTGKKAGEYRIVEKSHEPEDWKDSDELPVQIWLPWDLSDFAVISEGEIILIAGDPNAGKTAALLNIARYNMHRWDVHYLSTEISKGKFKRRAYKFDDVAHEKWKVKFYYQPPIVDTITGGRNKLWIVDYIELYNNFWEVGQILADIHKKLDGGILVAAVQKNPNSGVGIGGIFTQFKPALSIGLSHGVAKITKLKEWPDSWGDEFGNPNGKEYHFKLWQGWKIVKQKWWHYGGKN